MLELQIFSNKNFVRLFNFSILPSRLFICAFVKTLRLTHCFVQDLKLTEQVAGATEGQATRRVAQRAIRLGVEFKKYTIRTRIAGDN